jgi:hypothetical protein
MSPDHAQLCRNPVKHLADALADGVKSAAAAPARPATDIEHDIVAPQMLGKWLALCSRFDSVAIGHLFALFDPRNVSTEILETKCELARIKALRTGSELAALELLDDEPKTLDLAIALLDKRSHIAHQTMRQIRIGGQFVEMRCTTDYIRTC